jgi:DNA repair protein RadC
MRIGDSLFPKNRVIKWSMKPGRKLVELGAVNCQDQDVLAILIGTGIPGRSAETIAADIIERYGTLAALMGKTLEEIADIRGIGPVKAIRIAAAFELARRVIRDLEQNG